MARNNAKDYIYGRKEKQRLAAVHEGNLYIAAAKCMTYRTKSIFHYDYKYYPIYFFHLSFSPVYCPEYHPFSSFSPVCTSVYGTKV
jgi:hypothetical protein